MNNLTEKRTKKEIFRRYALFVFSLFVAALGVAITKRGSLGVSPISSVANVLSIRFTALTLGSWLILWNCALIAGQIVLLRKNFQWIQLLQIPLSFLFGWFTDLGMALTAKIPVPNYAAQIGLAVLGTIVLGFGISLSVIADVIMNSGEAFVKALSQTLRMDFGNVKIGFDVSCVLLALVLSLLFMHGAIVGAREGTVIAALCTGLAVKFFRKRTQKPLQKWLTRSVTPLHTAP